MPLGAATNLMEIGLYILGLGVAVIIIVAKVMDKEEPTVVKPANRETKPAPRPIPHTPTIPAPTPRTAHTPSSLPRPGSRYPNPIPQAPPSIPAPHPQPTGHGRRSAPAPQLGARGGRTTYDPQPEEVLNPSTPGQIPQAFNSRTRLNLDDILPVEPPELPTAEEKPRASRPRPRTSQPIPAVSETDFDGWPKNLHRPAQSWINKLPKPTEKTLPFYESSLRAAFACAWVDQKTDRAELNCLYSWAHYVQLHAKAQPGIAQRLRQVATEAEKAGRISNADCLRHADIVATHGTADARQSVGTLCLAVVTADKRLEQGEIPLIAGIWERLRLETEKLMKAFEKVIGMDKALKAAVMSADIEPDMSPEEKCSMLKQRAAILNGRMQSRRGADLDRDRAELNQVIRAIQIYKELLEHVR